MKTILFPILVLLFGFLCEASAQNQKTVDSLTAVLSTKVAGDRYSPLYELTFEYLDRNNEMALHFIDEAEKAALLSGDSLWIVKSKRVRGQILSRLQRVSDAVSLFESGLSIASRNHFDEESRSIYSTFGLADLHLGNFDKALSKFDTALLLAEQKKDTIEMIQNLNNIGVTYYQLEDARKALTYLFKAIEIKSLSPRRNTEGRNWPYINISLCYAWMHQYSTAKTYLEKSIQECAGGCTSKVQMHQELVCGLLYCGQNDWDNALKKFHASLRLARQLRDSRITFDNLVKISGILITENRIKEAERYLKDAELLMVPKLPFPSAQLDVYSEFCQVYEILGNHKKLAFYQHKYIQLKDSIFSRQLTSRLMTAEADFKERENNAKLASQDQIIVLNQGIIYRQRLLNVVTALLALVTLVFAVFIFLSYRRKQHLNKLLEEKVRARTMELEHSRDEMLRMLEEKDLRMRQTSNAIVTSVNSIEGLCLTAGKEIAHPMADSYLKRIKHISSGIVMSLRESLQDGVLQQVH